MSKPIGIYLRLSDEDKNEDESNSITSQRELIKEYLFNHTELSSCPILEFVDDGYSGTNFNRPGITELLHKAKDNQVECIVVKDFSRFGRNYIEVGNYIEQVFPFLGVRFISINDCYDSFKNANQSEFLSTAFKNIIYDLYSKDLSEKIISARRSKAAQGKFITAYAPYGYHKSKYQQLVKDEDTAPVVKRIFDMALDKVSKAEIARTLNRDGVPSPLMIRKQRNDNFHCYHVNEKCVWRTSTVSAILKDRRYIGDAVYGKVRPTSIGSGIDRSVSEEEWVVVCDTHEAIVSKEIFEKVGAMFIKNKAKYNKELYPLSGKVVCGACNHVISRESKKYKKGVKLGYRCSMLGVTNEYGCYPNKIREEEIEQAILQYLNHVGAIFFEDSWYDKKETDIKNFIQEASLTINQKKQALKRLSRQKLQAYEDYKDGKLEKEQYIKVKKDYDYAYEITSLEIEKENKVLNRLQTEQLTLFSQREQIKKYIPFTELSREIVEDFIDKVVVKPSGAIQVVWLSKDIFNT